LLDHNIILIDNIHFLDYAMQRIKWTQKNYMFWYILLMFATLSFYNVRKKYELLIILAILALSYFAVFGGYSRSARLSFVVGVLAYTILSIFQINKKYLLGFIWFLTLYIIFSPIILSFLDLGSYISELRQRDQIYNTSAALITEHWFLGYGYGSTLSIHLKDVVSIADLPKIYINVYPGGHPHNLSLLFWLEFGIFGALFLIYFIHKFLKYFIENTYLYINQAALFGMIVAFDIITSFSWSIWYPQVLLTFSFFGAMLVLSMNIQTKKNKYFEFIKDN
ncbi:O-antigen ligase family protein, partial [bacterium]|nr:O-antigen ligase family protein [bacterium]